MNSDFSARKCYYLLEINVAVRDSDRHKIVACLHQKTDKVLAAGGNCSHMDDTGTINQC